MQKRVFLRLAGLAAALLAGAAATPAAAQQQWKPSRPIKLIVPWASGGSTDQVTRLAALELERALGSTIQVVNQPGASGATGTKAALDAPRDGYTWTAGAAQDLGAYQTVGSLDTNIKDWHLFLHVANVTILSTNAKAPYKTAKDLLDAMKAKPGEIKVATAGNGSAGHTGMERVAAAAGVKYRHVTYEGGNPAVLATVVGEADVTTQLGPEQADMIRGKRLRPLAAIGNSALELEGFGTIPALSTTLTGFKTPANYFGIFIPKGVPDEVVRTVQKVWSEHIAKSVALRKYAAQKGALFAPVSGEAAQKAAFPAVQANAWLQYDNGKAKVKPDTVGIPHPQH